MLRWHTCSNKFLRLTLNVIYGNRFQEFMSSISRISSKNGFLFSLHISNSYGRNITLLINTKDRPFCEFTWHDIPFSKRRLTKLVIARRLFSKVWRSTGTKLKLNSASTGPRPNGKIWRNRSTLDWLLGCSLPEFLLLFRLIFLLKLSTGRLTITLPLGKERCRSLLMMWSRQQAVLPRKDAGTEKIPISRVLSCVMGYKI